MEREVRHASLHYLYNIAQKAGNCVKNADVVNFLQMGINRNPKQTSSVLPERENPRDGGG